MAKLNKIKEEIYDPTAPFKEVDKKIEKKKKKKRLKKTSKNEVEEGS